MEKNLNLKQIQEFFSKPLEENTFKKGDKVTYLGHPAVVTATKEYNGRNFVSVSYNKGKGKTKASDILATSGDVKAVNKFDKFELDSDLNETKYRVEYTTQDGEKAKSRMYNSEEEADKKEKKLVDSGVRKAKVVKAAESVDEASLSSTKSQSLANAINSAMLQIDDSMSYTDFADAVANILIDEYGTHNFTPFMEVLHARLGMNESLESTNWDEVLTRNLTDPSSDLFTFDFNGKRTTLRVTRVNKISFDNIKFLHIDVQLEPNNIVGGTQTIVVGKNAKDVFLPSKGNTGELELVGNSKSWLFAVKQSMLKQKSQQQDDTINESMLSEAKNTLLKQAKLSSAEYQKAKKLKDFNKDDYKWNPGESLYIKLNETDDREDDELSPEELANKYAGSSFFKENLAQTLAETIKLGEGVIEEELCPKGKAYIKRRKAAGEKSSAYLSGRAVKVCKGQMSGRKKKK